MFHAIDMRNGGSWLRMLALWELIEIFCALAHVPSAVLDSLKG